MLGGGLARGLVRRAVALGVAAGAAFIAMAAVGAAVFFALSIVLIPLAAAAITALLFALIALVIVLVFVRRDDEDAVEDEESMGLGQKAYVLFRQRPILGTIAALAGGYIFLRNPALATMVAAAFTEKSHVRPRRR